MRNHHYPLFLAIGSHAVALDRATGAELWRRKLKSSSFATVHFDGHSLFAAAGGEVFCLDPPTGEVLWHNRLPRLGHGVVSFGGDASSTLAAATAAQATMVTTVNAG